MVPEKESRGEYQFGSAVRMRETRGPVEQPFHASTGGEATK